MDTILALRSSTAETHAPPRAAATAACLEEISRGLRYQQIDPIVAALWPLAQSYGISRLAHETGISRTHLYRIFGAAPNPELGLILKIMAVLGVRLRAEPVDAPAI